MPTMCGQQDPFSNVEGLFFKQLNIYETEDISQSAWIEPAISYFHSDCFIP